MIRFVLTLALSSLLAAIDTPVIDLDCKRELFVDFYLIDSLKNVRLRLHSPQPAEIALRLDRPWEGLFCGYFTVIKDGDLYRMYYRGLPDIEKEQVTCLAESSDGIVWKRPNLGLHEVNDTRENNVILRGEGTHNFAPFIDTRPESEPGQKYKALGSVKGGLAAFASPDGIHWSKLSEQPALTRERHGEFDSQNVAFWSESEKCYVSYYRKFVNGVRSIGRATSDNFVNWSDGQLMSFGDTPPEHLYTNQTHPYYRAPHIYISFPMRFLPRRRTLSDSQARSVDVHPNYGADASDGVFMTTRGGPRYTRTFMEAFFRPGPDPGNWVSRTNMAALGVVPTGASEMSIYYSQHYAQPSHHIRRCVLRTDGFISVNAPYSGGELITKAFRFKGDKLLMNYCTSAAGSLRVELQDSDGVPIPGFTLADSPEIFGDRIDAAIAWQSGTDVSSLSGKTIRMRLVLKDADVYSFKFDETD